MKLIKNKTKHVQAVPCLRKGLWRKKVDIFCARLTLMMEKSFQVMSCLNTCLRSFDQKYLFIYSFILLSVMGESVLGMRYHSHLGWFCIASLPSIMFLGDVRKPGRPEETYVGTGGKHEKRNAFAIRAVLYISPVFNHLLIPTHQLCLPDHTTHMAATNQGGWRLTHASVETRDARQHHLIFFKLLLDLRHRGA